MSPGHVHLHRQIRASGAARRRHWALLAALGIATWALVIGIAVRL